MKKRSGFDFRPFFYCVYMFKVLSFAVENIGNDFSLVHMVLNTFDFLIILMTFACKYDNISVLGIVHAIFNCISAVRHDNILAIGFFLKFLYI